MEDATIEDITATAQSFVDSALSAWPRRLLLPLGSYSGGYEFLVTDGIRVTTILYSTRGKRARLGPAYAYRVGTAPQLAPYATAAEIEPSALYPEDQRAIALVMAENASNGTDDIVVVWDIRDAHPQVEAFAWHDRSYVREVRR